MNADKPLFKVWEWAAEGPFNPRYYAEASPQGLSYHCEIQGPFCGYDAVGGQTWDEFVTNGPLATVQMPTWIAEEIRAIASARTP